MFSMNIKGKSSIKLVSLEPSHNMSPKVIKPAVGETLLANHNAKKSNNQQSSSGLCQYVISELQPFT